MTRSASQSVYNVAVQSRGLSAAEQHINFLPFRLGRLIIAVEAFSVSTLGGPECDLLLQEGLPQGIEFVDLAQVVRQAVRAREYIIAKIPENDSQLLFAVDEILRMARVQLHKIRPLPPVTQENISVPFFFGVTAIQRKVTYLLDPVALSSWNRVAKDD